MSFLLRFVLPTKPDHRKSIPSTFAANIQTPAPADAPRQLSGCGRRSTPGVSAWTAQIGLWLVCGRQMQPRARSLHALPVLTGPAPACRVAWVLYNGKGNAQARTSQPAHRWFGSFCVHSFHLSSFPLRLQLRQRLFSILYFRLPSAPRVRMYTVLSGLFLSPLCLRPSFVLRPPPPIFLFRPPISSIPYFPFGLVSISRFGLRPADAGLSGSPFSPDLRYSAWLLLYTLPGSSQSRLVLF
ncbi:hypothetical protein C8R44DRAFT_873540 [Mycena epipterygia]|nr:hypothetical protein C8R44DRAFT_873540 [Mycena epipterygia]